MLPTPDVVVEDKLPQSLLDGGGMMQSGWQNSCEVFGYSYVRTTTHILNGGRYG